MTPTGTSTGDIATVAGNFTVPKFRTERMKVRWQKSIADGHVRLSKWKRQTRKDAEDNRHIIIRSSISDR